MMQGRDYNKFDEDRWHNSIFTRLEIINKNSSKLSEKFYKLWVFIKIHLTYKIL